ncbi:hypothetical protein I551_3673 [Mycobacterium ulcerans str. Harvey]|uniref:AMP-binding enzyme family protein n=1 Tax=Mycobacterium ulcerans str. Harvey TaxID=1299332 RepID=A0ABP3AF86_MYCUL|nr:hypothetical protein I551_3673 [Mycobacterium ulcerans str. Harvey]
MKVRGYRIELGEVQAALGAVDGWVRRWWLFVRIVVVIGGWWGM